MQLNYIQTHKQDATPNNFGSALFFINDATSKEIPQPSITVPFYKLIVRSGAR